MAKSNTKKKSKRTTQTDETFQHDMRPPAGILNVFSRLNYKPHYAIAEFVDNSTQSYFLHADELNKSEPDYEMTVRINYDAASKTLVVSDNAFGMERERFLDAITLDAKNPEQTNSRNEFGMGLKTAASWFGNVWTVSSTAYGSKNRFSATVDIPLLQDTGANNVSIHVEQADKKEHGTTITIKDVTKGLGPRSIGKIRSLLASMYRRDLQQDTINLYFNDEEIVFAGYPVLEFRDQQWKKNLDFDVKFAEKTYHVTGFVGIMNPGGFPKAGFALFRRNRVVIGGEDQNYKPQQIFGQAQSQVSLKLFGELDMDDFPVNQAKDGFIWDDGLEDEFIQSLRLNIREFVDIAKMSKEARVEEEQFSDEASARVEDEVSEAIKRANRLLLGEDDPEDSIDNDDPITIDGSQNPEELKRLFREEMESDNNKPEEFISTTRNYDVKIDPVNHISVQVNWKIGKSDKWIDVVEGEESIAVTININHPFFKPYSNEEEFQTVLEKLVISFVIAEEQAKTTSTADGYIYAPAIRNNMNRILQRLGA